jgi:hypothetical protein
MADGSLQGVEKLSETLRKMQVMAKGAARRAVLRLGEDVKQRAQELCPRDTGYLIASAYVVPYEQGAKVGFSAPYALPVHERTWVRHPNGGQARFLTQALTEAQVGAREKVAGYYRQEFER